MFVTATRVGYPGLVSRLEPSQKGGSVLVIIGWVAFCTSTSVKLLELRIAFVERHTLLASNTQDA